MAPPAEDDATLARRAGTGDRAALETLLDRHLERIHAICRRICGPDDALDATQEACLAIARGIPRFDGRAAFTTWAHRIAVNAALDELRRSRRRAVPASDEVERAIAAPSSTPGPERVADRVDLDRALDRVPRDFRIAVVLRDVADLDYAEIATVLGVPIGTVRSRIARGRAVLAETLGNSSPTTDVQGADHG